MGFLDHLSKGEGEGGVGMSGVYVLGLVHMGKNLVRKKMLFFPMTFLARISFRPSVHTDLSKEPLLS